MITDRFSSRSPVSAAQGRHGELIVVQGNGVRPARWGGAGAAVDAGMDAPDKPLDVAYSKIPQGLEASDLPHPVKPTPGPGEVPESGATKGRITIDPDRHYYIPRTDIYQPGNVYYSPPEVTYSTGLPITNGRGRPAKAQSYLRQSAVSEVRMVDSGKYYPEAPSVELSDSHGKGAVLTALLDAPSVIDTPENDSRTGLTGYDIIANGPWPDELLFEPAQLTRYGIYPLIDIPIESNGYQEIVGPWYGAYVLLDNGTRRWFPLRYTCKLTISGKTSGSGAVLRVNGSGHVGFWPATAAASAVPLSFGAGYSKDDDIVIRIHNHNTWVMTEGSGRIDYGINPAKDIVIRAFSGENPDNPGQTPYPLRRIRIDAPGDGYLVAPELKIVSNTGFGAYATCTVKDGKIATVTLENKGGGYTTPPEVRILSGDAEAFAVARPHLRGLYQCYYRYVDDTPEDSGGPIPSNLSPVVEVDCGEGATSLTWNVPAPTGRAKKVELWRSTSNQALTVYRVASVTGQFLDDMTDDELRDEEREGYAAMPIVLPNGELNAMRFVPPPDNKAAVVRFQDRHWYAVDTSGDEPNAVYFSEVDEPESVPKENELILQQNARDADSVRAIIPYGSTLLVMQARHAYSLTFSKQPLVDAQVTPIAYRGCLNQRCWEIHDGICYVMDQYGVYAVASSGAVETISDPIDDIFRELVDHQASQWHYLTVDPHHQTLRAFTAFKGDNPGGYPSVALCFSLETKSWWVERYPHRITAGTNVRLSTNDFRCVYAGQGGCFLLGDGQADLGRGSVLRTVVTNPGAGYKTPPEVSATGGTAAEFQASLNADGGVGAIWITNAGYGYEGGPLVIGEPNDPEHLAPQSATAYYESTPVNTNTPMFPVYRYKTGNSEYPTDALDPKAGSETSRSIAITYQPQPHVCDLSLRAYYNNAKYPRRNVAIRDRGTGFVHDTVDPAARLDMAYGNMTYQADSGVRTAMFAGRGFGDIQETDRHVAVELVGARKNTDPVIFYSVDVYGSG